MTIVIDGLAGLKENVGQHLGYSEWTLIDQERINEFAHATADHQWIHVDADRAATSPFGKTIAHGFLTLSLIPGLQHDIYKIRGIKMGINYGSDKVRFPAAVPVDSRVRLGATLAAVEELPKDSAQVRWSFAIEIEGGTKPACVAELLFRYSF